MNKVRGIRGATTAGGNSKDAILAATRELLAELIEANDIEADDVAAAIFTTTTDLDAEFPAVAARKLGWVDAGLLCGHEMATPDSQTHCIRVLVLINTDKAPQELENRYLRGAKNLRTRGMEEV